MGKKEKMVAVPLRVPKVLGDYIRRVAKAAGVTTDQAASVMLALAMMRIADSVTGVANAALPGKSKK